MRVRAATEKGFQRVVIEYARLRGWNIYHTHDSRRSPAGFPDLVLVRERVVFAELKSERGRLTVEQRAWLAALRTAGVEVFCWRPSQWDEIERTLS